MSPRTQLVSPCDASRSGHARQHAATRLSGPRGIASLALVLGISGCLVTSTPDFSPPKRTAPVLLTATALPDPRAVIIVRSTGDHIQFSTDFLPGNSGELPHFRLYLDYGAGGSSPGPPYRNEQKILYKDQSTDGG